jgi:hypothetical protein
MIPIGFGPWAWTFRGSSPLEGSWPVLLVLLASHAVAAPVKEAAAPELHTIERDLAEVSKPSTLAIAGRCEGVEQAANRD